MQQQLQLQQRQAQRHTCEVGAAMLVPGAAADAGVTLVSGDASIKLHVPESQLQGCDVLATMLQAGFKESRERSITLHSVSGPALAAVVEYLCGTATFVLSDPSIAADVISASRFLCLPELHQHAVACLARHVEHIHRGVAELGLDVMADIAAELRTPREVVALELLLRREKQSHRVHTSSVWDRIGRQIEAHLLARHQEMQPYEPMTARERCVHHAILESTDAQHIEEVMLQFAGFLRRIRVPCLPTPLLQHAARARIIDVRAPCPGFSVRTLLPVLHDARVRIRSLDLAQCSINAEGVRALLTSRRAVSSHSASVRDRRGRSKSNSSGSNNGTGDMAGGRKVMQRRFSLPALRYSITIAGSALEASASALKIPSTSSPTTATTTPRTTSRRAESSSRRSRDIALVVSGHRISSASLSQMSSWPAAVFDVTLLTSLCLDNNLIGVAGVVAVAQVLRRAACALTSLSLVRCGLGPDGLRALAAALADNESLVTLDAGWNDSDAAAVAMTGIAAAVASHAKLQRLGWAGNVLSRREHVDLARAAAQTTSRLTHVSLASTGVTDAAATGWVRRITQQSRLLHALQYLDVSGNHMSHQHCLALITAVSMTTCLDTLKISGNDINLIGARMLAAMLRQHTRLRVLHADGGKDVVRMGNEGAVALARGIMHADGCLAVLSLQHQGIRTTGASALLKACTASQGMAVLALGRNRILSSRTRGAIKQLQRQGCDVQHDDDGGDEDGGDGGDKIT